MNYLSYSIPLGRYFGINVRLHITFLIYAFVLASSAGNLAYGIAMVAGLYFCILLHEFGHALAARWCDGEANDILLWPLGGLAFVQPAWDPTAHLITTLAGPFVSLVLWQLFRLISFCFLHVPIFATVPPVVVRFVFDMWWLNRWLFLFNMLIPAFPIDCGRVVRDTLWHWMSAEAATKIAVYLSKLIAAVAVGYGICAWTGLVSLPFVPLSPGSAIVLGIFILSQTMHEQEIVAVESRGAAYGFSIRERLRRGRKQRAFRQAVRDHITVAETVAFHHCESCGLTELTARTMDFRVCPDCSNGQEYCRDHLDSHPHA